jgi:vesicle-fusing ATPase
VIDKLVFLSLDQAVVAAASTSRPSRNNNHNHKNTTTTIMKTTMKIGEQPQNNNERDEMVKWLRWIKASPSPMIVEFSERLRHTVNETIRDMDLERIEQTHDEFLSRLACRLILLPSGSSLTTNLQTAPGGIVYGKLLYGGVTRYRVIGGAGGKGRRVGERTMIAQSGQACESWLQYGGPERNYDAMDMGPCALMEFTILPKGLESPLVYEEKGLTEMTIAQVQCNPDLLFHLPEEADNNIKANQTTIQSTSTTESTMETDSLLASEMDYIEGLETSFTNVVGGLEKEVEAIVRRVLDGRAMTLKSGAAAQVRAKDLQVMLDLGLTPVRGLLLYGPPGCGKTALAREISKLLTERPPKIAAAPELLDRWVGGSEKLVRDLFGDAEDELRLCGGDVAKSGLHVVVIDEVDAVFRKRTANEDSGEVARASAVNQILAKLDGVKSLGNVLVIGTTNRKELLDEALLRPGRLEVQVEVPLPDPKGRREIFQIHFDALRRRGRLSKSLCEAIDGVSSEDEKKSPFRLFSKLSPRSLRSRTVKDLALDRWTKGFSGADIEGLVRCAGSLALARARQDGSGVDGLIITLEDVLNALDEIKK